MSLGSNCLSETGAFCGSKLRGRGEAASLALWSAVNKRRYVCGQSVLSQTQRSAQSLVNALYEMRLYWIKGVAWQTAQNGDDPALLAFNAARGVPMPRSVFAHISWEGICNYSYITVPLNVFTTFIEDGAWALAAMADPTVATATATVTNGAITNIAIKNSGKGYSSPPLVSFFGGPGNGATATTTLNANGGVSSIQILNGGNSYLPNTVVSLFAPGANTVTFTAWRQRPVPYLPGIARVVNRMQCTATGRGYIYPPNYTNSGAYRGPPQWDNEIPSLTFQLGSMGAPYISAGPGYMQSALTWDSYTGGTGGASLDAIMRFEAGVGTGDATYLQYLVTQETDLIGFTESGIVWPGIVYGIQNPATNVPQLVAVDYVTDTPFISGGEIFPGQTNSPIPLGWMVATTQGAGFYNPGAVYPAGGPLGLAPGFYEISGGFGGVHISDWAAYNQYQYNELPSLASSEPPFILGNGFEVILYTNTFFDAEAAATGQDIEDPIYSPEYYWGNGATGDVPEAGPGITQANISPNLLNDMNGGTFSGSIVRSNYGVGWMNVCAEYPILDVAEAIDPTILHDWIQRIANVGMSGAGVCNVRVTAPAYSAYGGTIMAWVYRTLDTYLRTYGPDVFIAGEVEYYVATGGYVGLTNTGQTYNTTVVTTEDVFETEVDIVQESALQISIMPWSNNLNQNLSIPDALQIPDNYVGDGTGDIVIGDVFGANTSIQDFYCFFLQYDFTLDA